MKKSYKHLVRGGKVYILHWETVGVLFGADWKSVAVFDNTPANLQRCIEIVRLMNNCNQKESDERN